MSSKRLRIFAGPNGSGKSTITKIVLDHVHLGTYINADDIKVLLSDQRYLDFMMYGVTLNEGEFVKALHSSSLSTRIKSIDETLANIEFQDNSIVLKDGYVVEDYFVSFITSYIWNKSLDVSKKFTIETVMSHPSKLDFMRRAKEKGFKVYLYFVTLANPELNKHRVKTRIEQGGHPVEEKKIGERYYRTMQNLYEALKIADSAYLFDNSSSEPNMFAVKEKGIMTIESKYIPKWFQTYVLDVIAKK